MKLDYRPRVQQGRFKAYAKIMRLHRPIGILLLLWPALWALWIAARGWPDPFILGIFLLGTVVMRSAGCVINDFADREFDGYVARTQGRPLPAGEVSDREAAWLFVILIALAALLVSTLNEMTIALSFAAIGLAVIYPFMKRYTYLPQVYLGAAFGWAVPMAFAAQNNAVPALAWLIFSAVILWVLVYDTEYAMVDREDDLRVGIKSTAILFDEHDRLLIGVFQVMLLADLILIGRQAELRWPFYAALGIGGVLFIYQQWLIRARRPAACFAAFMHNNWFGLVIFIGIGASFARF